jgi:hypothetical protein
MNYRQDPSQHESGVQISVGIDHVLGGFGKVVGVEPDISVENAQLTDSVNARNKQNGMFAKSAYKSRTKYS